MTSRRRRQPAVQSEHADRPAGFLLSFCKSKLTWETAAPAILFLFGAWLAVLYFGHQAVPNSDFPAFVRTAQDLLHFQLPYSFKRLPGLGLLQIALGTVMPGPYPTLTAGLLLNALMYPFCGLLLYGIAKRFMGRGAFWIALVALVNPWVLRWLVHPIVEVPLIFFFLLTFYLLFEKGRWAYPAAFAASMIRYEGAILILIVFVWDLFRHRGRRQWLIAAGLSFLTGLPVALWVLGQVLGHGSGGTDDYLSSYQSAAKGRAMVFGRFSNYVWRESIGAYTKLPSSPAQPEEEESETPDPSRDGMPPARMVLRINQGLLIAGLLAAVGWGFHQKRWDVISLFLFAGVYFLLHASRTGTRPRYVVPIAWIVCLVCLYGIQSVWEIIQGKRQVPKPVIAALQLILFAVSAAGALSLIRTVSDLKRYSPQSAWIPLAALIAAVLFALIRLVRTKGRELTWLLAAVGLTSFVLMSNQVDLLQRVGSGAMDQEFKDLATWYLKNSSPGEKMVTTMPQILSLFAPEKQNLFVHTRWIAGDSTEEFIQDCYKRNITYVAWDSRLGLALQNAYYRMYKLDRIAFLGPRSGPDNKMVLPPKKNGPFQLIGAIQNSHYPFRFIFIYRLDPLPSAEEKANNG